MKKEPTPPKTEAATTPQSNNTLAILSLVFGVTSLMGPGLFFGIPAIVIGAIALKKGQGERGLSIAGLVTGIVSTAISLLVVALLALLVMYGATHPEEMKEDSHRPAVQGMLHERS